MRTLIVEDEGFDSLSQRVTTLESGWRSSLIIPVFANLFGPVQMGAGLTQAVGPTWAFPGSALTSSTKGFQFQFGYPVLKYARWLITWSPRSSVAGSRLVHMDDGPLNITEIAQVIGENTGSPRVRAVDVTAALNQLIAGKVFKHVGFQMKDDGATAWTLYESRLELNFTL